MQQMVNQVNQAMGKQTEAADNAAHSMEEVNQVAQKSQTAVQEMSQSTTNLVGQAEDLKQLASSFESEEELAENGKIGQTVGQ
jgi:methyl-accepting chemotaxis protein